MPAIVRVGDTGSGHGGFSPRPNDQGSPSVFVNGIPVHRQGDHWLVHTDGFTSHDSTLASGSSTVFVNSKQIARIGDPVVCGSTCAAGSGNVFAGG